MREYIFGANILENLTTGMYQDSKVIYREYIQNACDQIDKAYNIGLLKPNEGRIDIIFYTAFCHIENPLFVGDGCPAEFLYH